MSTIEIEANGTKIQIKENSTVKDFIEERKVTGGMFVVEKNKQIIQKQDYATERIAQGDKIELVGFFGGG